MKFIGYISKVLLELTNTLFAYNDNYVFRDNDNHIKLAIKVTAINGTENCALFLWDEFAVDDERNQQIIQEKSDETVRFFQESIGLLNHPYIYYDVQTIVRANGTKENYQESLDTDIITNKDVISLEYDYRRDVWLVKIKGIVSYSFNNENSAKQVFRLITKDIINYIRFRWG